MELGNVEQSITDKLRIALGKFEELEDDFLPHHFDEALIGKLIDAIDYSSDNILNMIKSELASNDIFEMNSPYAGLIVKLLDKVFITKGVLFSPPRELKNVVDCLQTFLEQGRPNDVLSAVFSLCVSSHYCSKAYIGILQWGAEHFSDKSSVEKPISAFVRNNIEKLFKTVTIDNFYTQEAVKTLVSLLKENDIKESHHVINSLARIAMVHPAIFKSEWDCNHIMTHLLNCYPTGRELGREVFMYLAENLNITHENQIILTTQYPQFSMLFWSAYREKFAFWPNGVEAIFMEHASLEQICDIFGFLTDLQIIETKISELLPILDNPRRTDDEYFVKFICIICHIAGENMGDENESRISQQKERIMIKISEYCSSRIANSQRILDSFCKNFSSLLNAQKSPKLMAELDRIIACIAPEGNLQEDHETLTFALEIAKIASIPIPVEIDDVLLFHESPYVCVAALEYSLKHFSNEIGLELCKRVITKSITSQPRLPALKFLHDSYPASEELCLAILETSLEDEDNENRLAAYDIARSLLNNQVYAVRPIIEKYSDDGLLAARVCSDLGLTIPASKSQVEIILDQIIAALEIKYVDVPDCS